MVTNHIAFPQFGRDVPLPQPAEEVHGIADLTVAGEQDGDGEEEEEGLEGGEPSFLVLECLPAKLRAKISCLVEVRIVPSSNDVAHGVPHLDLSGAQEQS